MSSPGLLGGFEVEIRFVVGQGRPGVFACPAAALQGPGELERTVRLVSSEGELVLQARKRKEAEDVGKDLGRKLDLHRETIEGRQRDVETVRKNMWILNNRFAYDKTLGGFYRPGDVRKGAIALITSPAAAAKVKGGPETVRPPPKKGQRWQHNKRPKKIRVPPDERTPTISYPPRK